MIGSTFIIRTVLERRPLSEEYLAPGADEWLAHRATYEQGDAPSAPLYQPIYGLSRLLCPCTAWSLIEGNADLDSTDGARRYKWHEFSTVPCHKNNYTQQLKSDQMGKPLPEPCGRD